MIKTLVIVLSDKGGTGKTTFSRGYADYLRRTTTSAFLQDADGDVGQLLQYYGSRDDTGRLLENQDGSRGVAYFSILDRSRRDAAVDGIDADAATILMDLPAGSIGLIKDFDDEIGFFDLARRHGYRIVLVNVITPMLASIRTIGTMLDAFEGETGVNFVIVKNRFFGPEEDDWDKYNGSRTRSRLTDRGGQEIALPSLRMRSFVVLDELNLGFTAASMDSRVRTADKSVLIRWIKSFDGEIGKIQGIL